MYQLGLVWWLVSKSDGKGLSLGVALLLSALPSILLVKWTGKLLDTSSTKRVLLTCDLALVVVMGFALICHFTGGLNLGEVYLLMLMQSTFQAVYDPALSKMIPQVAEGEAQERLVSLMGATQPAAYFLGATVGAVVVEKLGVSGLTQLAMIGYLWAFFSNWRLQVAKPLDSVEAKPTSAVRLSGIRATWSALPNSTRIALVAFALVNFFVTPTLVILPVVVERDLFGSANTLSLLEAVLWFFLMAGTLMPFSVRQATGNPTLILKTGSLLLWIMGTGFAVCSAALFVTPDPAIRRSLVAFGVGTLGLMLGLNNVRFMAWFQATVADSIKGRFFALMQGVIGFLIPIGHLFFGFLLDRWSSGYVILVQAVGVGSIAVAMALQSYRNTSRISSASSGSAVTS